MKFYVHICIDDIIEADNMREAQELASDLVYENLVVSSMDEEEEVILE